MIPIHFDGRYIWGNLRNGPYRILNGFLYPSDDIGLGLDVPDAGLTQQYNYLDFDAAAVITGTVSSAYTGIFPEGARIESDEATDFVDGNGHYRLIYLNAGTKNISLTCAEFPQAEWDVYHNGFYVGHQSYADISVAIGRIDTVDFVTDHPLPVELVSFYAVAGDNQVTLRWSTASETDNAQFDILRDRGAIAQVRAAGEAHTYEWTDTRAVNGSTYVYSLVSVDVNGTRNELGTVSATPSMNAAIITEYALHQNFPNPFNATTQIVYDMKDAGMVSIKVYNVLGQQVAVLLNGTVTAGRHIVSFKTTDLPSGVYVYKMETYGFRAQNKMLLLK
jgi:hypothetical protein